VSFRLGDDANLKDNVPRRKIQLRDGEGGEAEWDNDMGPF